MKKLCGWVRQPHFWGFLALMAVMVLWVICPEITADAGKTSLKLCGEVVIPSLFPFFVLTNFVVACGYHRYLSELFQPLMGPLFSLPGAAASAISLGIFGGYPMGGATVFALYDQGELDSNSASKILGFCNFIGIGFAFGVIGFGIFRTFWAGFAIWFSHIFAGLFWGIFSNFGQKISILKENEQKTMDFQPSVAHLVTAVKRACSTVITVSGFLIFFGVIIAFLQAWHFTDGFLYLLLALGLEENFARAVISSSLEMTSLMNYISPQAPSAVLLSLLGFLLGWGGLCVYCQIYALRGDRKISMGYYLRGKIAQGILGSIFTPLVYFFPAFIGILVAFPIIIFVRSKNRLEKTASMEYNGQKGGVRLVVSEKN